MPNWLGLFLLGSLLGARAPAAPALDGEDGPRDSQDVRLVVLIVVDQLVPEELDRLRERFRGGLHRLLEEGLVFTEAAHQHAVTETAPGHATLGTGCHPAQHGLVANEWWSRAAAARSYCVADPAARALRAGPPATDGAPSDPGRSPRNLRRPSLAEILRAADGRSKSCSIAGKDRAAIGMGGRSQHCLWWDLERGGFESSSAYGADLPPWVRAWNAVWVERLLDGPFGSGWFDDLAAMEAGEDQVPDARAGEGGHVFPYALEQPSEPPSSHDLRGLATFAFRSPACDGFVIELAGEAVRALELGLDEHPDVLTLGLSANDVVGHECGPGSRENTDLILRADEALGALFELFDERVGRGRWIAALSADHGVLPLPEELALRGVASRRVGASEVARSVRAARAALEQRWHDSLGLTGDSQGVRVSPQAVAATGLELAEVRAEVAAALEQAGETWIERALTFEQLAAAARGEGAADELVVLVANSFDADRSPDVAIVCKPWLLVGMSSGTSHGTPHPYDRRVPLVFFGPGFTAGQRPERAATVDVVPTLLDRAGIAVPAGLDGVVLAPR